MSGNRYVLDTNAIIALLQGNIQLVQLLQNASWIGISIRSKLLNCSISYQLMEMVRSHSNVWFEIRGLIQERTLQNRTGASYAIS